jgi:hypothetical protein
VNDRKVTAVRKNDSGVIAKLCGPWGEVKVTRAVKQIQKRKHRYYAEYVDRAVLEVVTSAPSHLQSVVDQSHGKTLEDLPNIAAVYDEDAERRALKAAVIASFVLRVIVVAGALAVGYRGKDLDSSLRWSLVAIACFVGFSLLLDLLWYFVHSGDASPPTHAPTQTGANSAAALMIPTAAAVIAFVTGIGTNITTTTKVGVVALAAAILLGILLAGLQGANPAKRIDRVVLVVMVNLLLFAFAFGLVCLALSLAVKG